MISVKIKYHSIIRNNNTVVIYDVVEVKGHADNNSGVNNEHVCSLISCVLNGSRNFFEVNDASVTTIGKGYYLMKRKRFELKNDKINVGVDVIVSQLYAIYTNYPSYFKCFNFYEEGGN